MLKPTGSLYLHCDPTASHYLKLLLDGVFGPRNFKNEIAWKRTSSHNDASQGLSRFGKTHDVIFFYAKEKGAKWNLLSRPMDTESAAVGRLEDGFGRTYPKLQIITLAELFQGKKPHIPFVDPASVKRAKREETGLQDKHL